MKTELVDESQCYRTVYQTLSRNIDNYAEVNEQLVESNKEVNRHQEQALENDTRYDRLVEERNLSTRVINVEALKAKSLINSLTVELTTAKLTIQAQLTEIHSADSNAEYNQKISLTERNKSLKYEQEAMEAAIKLQEERQKAQSTHERPFNAYKEKSDACMRAIQGRTDYNNWPREMWKQMQKISEHEHPDPNFENSDSEEDDRPANQEDVDTTVENVRLRGQVLILAGKVEELAHERE